MSHVRLCIRHLSTSWYGVHAEVVRIRCCAVTIAQERYERMTTSTHLDDGCRYCIPARWAAARKRSRSDARLYGRRSRRFESDAPGLS
jgi:hypothetical protein